MATNISVLICIILLLEGISITMVDGLIELLELILIVDLFYSYKKNKKR